MRFHLYAILEKTELLTQKSDRWFPGGWGAGESRQQTIRGMWALGAGVRTVLGLDGGTGEPTACVCQNARKHGKKGEFYCMYSIL